MPANDESFGYTYPAAQFLQELNGGSTAIAGGYAVENGSALDGQFIYGEFASTGDVYHSSLSELQAATTSGAPAELAQAATYRASILFDDDGAVTTPAIPKASMLDVIDDSPMYDGVRRADLRFGQGPAGELYITSKRNNTIYLVSSSDPDFAPCDSGGSAPPCDEAPPIVSSILIRARGVTGVERMKLAINGSYVATFNNVSTAWATYSFDVPSPVGVDELRVSFTNKGRYRGVVKRLQVDYVDVGESHT